MYSRTPISSRLNQIHLTPVAWAWNNNGKKSEKCSQCSDITYRKRVQK